jgi:hypothetical protein
MVMMAEVCRLVSRLAVGQDHRLDLTGLAQQADGAIDGGDTQVASASCPVEYLAHGQRPDRFDDCPLDGGALLGAAGVG